MLRSMMDQNLFWIPRNRSVMTADQYVPIFLGFELSAAIGGFRKRGDYQFRSAGKQRWI